MDVFDEAFRAQLDEVADQLVKPRAQDPRLLGYAYTDGPPWTVDDEASNLQLLRHILQDQYRLLFANEQILGAAWLSIKIAAMTATGAVVLGTLSGLVLAHPGLKLESEGHTDATGSDSLNQRLSEQRAEAVRAYLESQGIAAANLSAQGFGKEKPVADNATAKGRQQNRRVEIVLSDDSGKLIAR